MSATMRPAVWAAARLAFGLAVVALIASRLDLAGLGRTLASSDPLWLLLGFVVALGSWAPGSLKWQRLLLALGSRAPFRLLFGLNLVGQFYGLFLPGQMSGEVIKGVKLARRGVPGASTAISIGVDRLTGVMALAALALGGLAVAPRIDGTPALALAALGILLLAVSPLLALWGAQFVPPGALVQLERQGIWRPVGAVIGALTSLGRSFFEYRRSPRTLIVALALSVVVQVMVVLANYCAARALGVAVEFSALTWIVAMVSILHIVPVSVAGLGLREGAYVVLLGRYGVPDEQGLALALAVFGMILAQGLAGGVVDLVSGLGRLDGAEAPPVTSGAALPLDR